MKPEPKIESRPAQLPALPPWLQASLKPVPELISELYAAFAPEPRLEPRQEQRQEPRQAPMRDTARDLRHELYCERKRDDRQEPGPRARQEPGRESKPEPKHDPKQDPKQEPGTEPSPQYRKQQQQDQQPPPLPGRDPQDAKPQPDEVAHPTSPEQPEPALTPRPSDQRQRMGGKPPHPDPNPLPASPLPPDDVFRFGPIQWQWPGPSTEPPPELDDRLALPWPSSSPLPEQRLGLRPYSAGFYASLRDALGNTLLMQACRAGHAELLAFLLDACPLAYAQALNAFGRNAAMIARDHGHHDLLAMLLQAGVELQPENPALQWYLQNRAELAMGVRTQDWQPLALLLAQDHFMNLRDANGRTLIFHAVMHADLDAVRFLCGCHDAPFIGWKDVYGNSVFRYTTRIPNVETGAAICQELRTYRRRTRWQHKRRRWHTEPDERGFDSSEPAWRDGGEADN